MIENLTPNEQQLKTEFATLLHQFGEVLLEKLLTNERKYKWGDSWKMPDWKEQLQRAMLQHLQKGDPRDVAIYSLFAWYHGWPTAEITPQLQGRPIASLKIEEAKTVFALAFGYGPVDALFHYKILEPIMGETEAGISVDDTICMLVIQSDAYALAWSGIGEKEDLGQMGFYAYKVFEYLKSIGIVFNPSNGNSTKESLANIIAQGEADFAAGKGTIMTIEELRKLSAPTLKNVTSVLQKLSESIPVEWDRYTLNEDFYVVYGWIKRTDNERDFLMISMYEDDSMQEAFYTTSSAKYSEKIAEVLYGTAEGHNPCQKIEQLLNP